MRMNFQSYFTKLFWCPKIDYKLKRRRKFLANGGVAAKK